MKQVSGDVYKCNTCAKTFVAKGLLQRHLSQVYVSIFNVNPHQIAKHT